MLHKEGWWDGEKQGGRGKGGKARGKAGGERQGGRGKRGKGEGGGREVGCIH